jgi:hypothetical protein
MNVGFVGVLSCLVLVLALFFSTGVASAHSTAVHSQTSVTSVSTLKGHSKGPHAACKSVYRNGRYVRVCQTCRRTYVTAGRTYYGVYYRNGGYYNVCHY